MSSTNYYHWILIFFFRRFGNLSFASSCRVISMVRHTYNISMQLDHCLFIWYCKKWQHLPKQTFQQKLGRWRLCVYWLVVLHLQLELSDDELLGRVRANIPKRVVKKISKRLKDRRIQYWWVFGCKDKVINTYKQTYLCNIYVCLMQEKENFVCLRLSVILNKIITMVCQRIFLIQRFKKCVCVYVYEIVYQNNVIN